MKDVALGLLPNQDFCEKVQRLLDTLSHSVRLTYQINQTGTSLPLYIARQGLERFSTQTLAKGLVRLAKEPLPILRFRHRLDISADGTVFYDIENPSVCDQLYERFTGTQHSGEPTRYGYIMGTLENLDEIRIAREIFLNREDFSPTGVILGRVGRFGQFTHIYEIVRLDIPTH